MTAVVAVIKVVDSFGCAPAAVAAVAAGFSKVTYKDRKSVV